MQCPRCLNEDDRYFYKGSKGYYCRKCIAYGRILFDAHEPEYYYEEKNLNAEIHLPFELTLHQQKISHAVAQNYNKNHILIWAACGAGKTEIVLEAIKKAIDQHQSVGIAIPRRQVVIEIGERLKRIFPNLDIIYVCEGYTQVTEGDIIVCTTHQLYRYRNRFDLLILDEPDAFPFKGNEVLHGIARTSCKGHIIALSATPDDSLKKYKTYTLFKRPHGFPLIEPKILYLPKIFQFLYVSYWIKSREKSLIFVPTRRQAKKIGELLQLPFITSLSENKEEIIQSFRNDRIKHLVCTTILERGVTFSNIHVLILQADHSVFDESSLIQITGRVGRDVKYPYGEAILLCSHKSKAVTQAKKSIRKMNA